MAKSTMLTEEFPDLRQYIAIFIRYWPWPVGLGVVAAIVAFAVFSLLPPTYQAEASGIILKSDTRISFEPTIQTVDEPLDPTQFQQTLVKLVTSGEVAARVLAQAGDVLPPEVQNVSSLLEQVQASNTGDIILITFEDHDAQLAAQLATLWAQTYETYVNQLFGASSGSFLVEVQDQVQEVARDYGVAQTNLEQFLNDNQIAMLERRLNLKEKRIETLQATEIAIFERELIVQTDQAQALRMVDARTENLPLDLLNLALDTTHQTLANKYEELQQIESQLQDAQTMRDQLQEATTSGSAQAGRALALILLQSQVLASSTTIPVELQLNTTDLTNDTVSTADVESLLEVLETRKERVEQEITELSDQLAQTNPDVGPKPRSEQLSGRLEALDNEILYTASLERPMPDDISQIINTLDTEVRTLTAELEQQIAQKRELEQARDLAWENYTAIQRKLTEVQLSAQLTDSQVRVATQALTPTEPVAPRRLLNTAIAGVGGFFLVLFAVFALIWWRGDDNVRPVRNAEEE